MRETLLKWLVCPTCQSSLALRSSTSDGEEILEGDLSCGACGAHYPVVRGVARMLSRTLNSAESGTVRGFGWQWQRFDEINSIEEERDQFLDWVHPLTASDFESRVVLDAGCGMGRWPETVALMGAQEVLAIDMSSAVEAAFPRLREYPNVHVIQGNILEMPLRHAPDSEIDLAYSIGVLHHMPDPKAGIVAMARHIRAGGAVHAWLYGLEGNAWIERLVSPVRVRLTSKLPKALLYYLTHVLGLPLHVVSHLVHATGLGARTPYGAYLDWLGQFSFRHTHHIVFDHLVPDIAHYLPYEYVVEMAELAELIDVEITPRNENSWRLVGRHA